MRTKTFAIAASLVLSLSGAALAQTAAGSGSTEGNMNNPGSVKSNSEKGSTGSATGAAMGADRMAAPGASGGASTAATGAPAGSTGGNGVTGSGAAPSGK
ncbi:MULTISPECIES: hypothetical protein [Methylobacterium]|uniref:hypothetical protein n=1 Tax=Methylobacterium TaxID=407 RepID=UPI0011C99764|nr:MULTISPECIES: hypothetical protein [Methylobacterium]TXM66548.1 hypothetical protein FV229_12540 [Methylobacterium sp. WL120]